MVEKASRRFRLSCVNARSEEPITVKPAIQPMTSAASRVRRRSTPKTPVTTRSTQKTPTFTTATAWSSAETGVGATMAPGSQE